MSGKYDGEINNVTPSLSFNRKQTWMEYIAAEW